jgi:hypothetical protein
VIHYPWQRNQEEPKVQPHEIAEKVEKPPDMDIRRPEKHQVERARPSARDLKVHEAYNAQRDPEKRAYEAQLFKRNERAMRHTVETAEVIQPDKAGKHAAVDKIQGQIGESVHHYNNGGAIGLVNDLNNDLGKHNALFDSSSSRELTSIKTHLSEKNQNAPAAYAKDLREMVGAQDDHKHDMVTGKLWEMRKNDGREWDRAEAILPPSVTQARTPEAMKSAIIDEAVLRIPSDQVAATRAHVVRNAMRSPELYGIDPKAPPLEREMRANMLAMKVRPLAEGVTSHDLRVMTRQCYQNKFGLK